MSAPTDTRIPTPGDLARRAALAPVSQPEPGPARPAGAAGMVAPGELRPNEILRQLYQQGIRISGMHPEARLVALTLLGYANFRTGLLNKYQPSTSDLGQATGLTQGQAEVQLRILAQRGWLSERRVTRGPRQGQLIHQLHIPTVVLLRLRKARAGALTDR